MAAAIKCAGLVWALLACEAYAQVQAPGQDTLPDTAGGAASELIELLDESVIFLRERLPFQIDLTTRLTAISREGRTLVYQYQVERVTRRALEGHAAVLGRRTCSNEQLFRLLNIGGAVRYAYQFKETGERLVHEITLQECHAGAIAL